MELPEPYGALAVIEVARLKNDKRLEMDGCPLTGAFLWSSSRQGASFWASVANGGQPAISERQFREWVE